jgi:SAM-dependent methyltransferase
MSNRVFLSLLARPPYAGFVALNKLVKKLGKRLTPAQRSRTKMLRAQLNNIEIRLRKFTRANSINHLIKKRSSRISSRISARNSNRSLHLETGIFDIKTDSLPLPRGFVPHRGKHPFGAWQLEFLIKQGLLPTHRICDIGCGDMREGVPLIRYLEPGSYIGYDQSQSALSQGIASLTSKEIKTKKPLFLWGYDFNIESFIGEDKCDLAWANSVWTHLNLTVIVNSMESVLKILKNNGRFLVTFFEVSMEDYMQQQVYRAVSENKNRILMDVSLSTAKAKKDKFTYPNRNPFHHPSTILCSLAKQVGYSDAYVHQELTPKGQSILVLSK